MADPIKSVLSFSRFLKFDLVSACLEHGARHGHQRAVTGATNKVSQHIFRKLGLAECERRSYLTHQFCGRAAIASIAEQEGDILMDKFAS